MSDHFRQSRHQRVPRAELLFLFDTESLWGRIGKRSGRTLSFDTHKIGLMTDQCPYTGKPGELCRFFQYQRKHGVAQQCLKRFRPGRGHTRALARRKDQNARRILHCVSS